MNWYALVALSYWAALAVTTVGSLVYHRRGGAL